MKGIDRSAIGLLLGLAAASAMADSFLVDAPVLEVTPLTRAERVSERVGDCDPARPPADAGLALLLAWDLRADCRTVWTTREHVEGYRVRYRVDGRVYTRVLDHDPGDHLPVRLTIR